ncbi:AAA family ATPase [Agrobacterium sp.]|jgi:putative ATP-dependent endonuclease of OLD family|uniref:ATP-dependent nuclease n=1 Tax=Agrobacterium sp. TaxID=361 RepID=UPI0028A800D8
MRIARVNITNFRGIKTAEILLPTHAVLIGDNNVGKSTVLEAIDLCLGPDRLNRLPPIDEHDFHLGQYLATTGVPQEADAAEVALEPEVETDTIITAGPKNPIIEIELTVTGLSPEQQDYFNSHIEWWHEGTQSLFSGSADELDVSESLPAIRVTFRGWYEEEEDDFTGKTFYTRSLNEDETASIFGKRDKQKCGFLYLRTIRTGSRALSLERGSLLDIILRLKEIRPKMWEDTLRGLKSLEVATSSDVGLSEVLASVARAMKKYVPKEWGTNPHLRISNLTREHLRKVITAFIATGEGVHAAPFFRQGTGTINMLVLALLSQIAEDKQNVIFAMEEVETAIPPYAQKRIVHELRHLSAQSIVTSHSPYVLEEFSLEETLILSRSSDGVLSKSTVQLPESLKLKRYRQDFRQRFCECLLAGRVLVVEGTTEASSFPAVARRLAELKSETYQSLEALGISVFDAGSDSQVAPMAELFDKLGKRVFGACDQQTEASEIAIKAQVEKLYMHNKHGFEAMVLEDTTDAAMKRFADIVEWPQHLTTKYGGDPKSNVTAALMDLFTWNKGGWSAADFLAQCSEAEIPKFLKDACKDLKDRCAPLEHDEKGHPSTDGGSDAA